MADLIDPMVRKLNSDLGCIVYKAGAGLPLSDSQKRLLVALKDSIPLIRRLAETKNTSIEDVAGPPAYNAQHNILPETPQYQPSPPQEPERDPEADKAVEDFTKASLERLKQIRSKKWVVVRE
jgi:hypothetical protein